MWGPFPPMFCSCAGSSLTKSSGDEPTGACKPPSFWKFVFVLSSTVCDFPFYFAFTRLIIPGMIQFFLPIFRRGVGSEIWDSMRIAPARRNNTRTGWSRRGWKTRFSDVFCGRKIQVLLQYYVPGSNYHAPVMTYHGTSHTRYQLCMRITLYVVYLVDTYTNPRTGGSVRTNQREYVAARKWGSSVYRCGGATANGNERMKRGR